MATHPFPAVKTDENGVIKAEADKKTKQHSLWFGSRCNSLVRRELDHPEQRPTYRLIKRQTTAGIGFEPLERTGRMVVSIRTGPGDYRAARHDSGCSRHFVSPAVSAPGASCRWQLSPNPPARCPGPERSGPKAEGMALVTLAECSEKSRIRPGSRKIYRG